MAISIERAETVGSPPRRERPRPEINITPLVDVVLVLLIIFMVVTPQLESGEAVELPVIANPDPKGKSKLDPITVTYTASGRYLVEKEAVELPALAGRLAKEHEAHPDRRLVLKGDKTLPFGKMRELFAMCKDIGFAGVSLSVGEKTRRKGE